MKKYTRSTWCRNRNASGESCLQCSKCGRKFRKGILVDNTGREFHKHIDDYFERNEYGQNKDN